MDGSDNSESSIRLANRGGYGWLSLPVWRIVCQRWPTVNEQKYDLKAVFFSNSSQLIINFFGSYFLVTKKILSWDNDDVNLQIVLLVLVLVLSRVRDLRSTLLDMCVFSACWIENKTWSIIDDIWITQWCVGQKQRSYAVIFLSPAFKLCSSRILSLHERKFMWIPRHAFECGNRVDSMKRVLKASASQTREANGGDRTCTINCVQKQKQWSWTLLFRRSMEISGSISA